ncbi:hypothetical protein pb186bvf_002353 [Paramecium bursaria]
MSSDLFNSQLLYYLISIGKLKYSMTVFLTKSKSSFIYHHEELKCLQFLRSKIIEMEMDFNQKNDPNPKSKRYLFQRTEHFGLEILDSSRSLLLLCFYFLIFIILILLIISIFSVNFYQKQFQKQVLILTQQNQFIKNLFWLKENNVINIRLTKLKINLSSYIEQLILILFEVRNTLYYQSIILCNDTRKSL